MEHHLSSALMKDIDSYARSCHEEELDLLRQLAAIGAPTRHEERRAAFVATWLREQGAGRVSIDGANNVICLLGPEDAPLLVAFAAHTDVVFDDRETLPLEEDRTRLYAPGVGDDTANLVGLLMACAYLLRHPDLLPHGRGVLVVANACEEGLGNCDGTRAVFGAYGDRIREYVSFDLYLPGIVDTPVGSHRHRVSVRTQGGHSYHDFGRPNAIAELSSLICELYALAPASGPFLVKGAPVTLNVGTIEGGTTINAIAAHAQALVEYRSTSEKALAAMREELDRLMEAHRRPGVEIGAELVGIRPGMGTVDPGALRRLTDRNATIVQAITGCEPSVHSASTDANIPLSLGIPANTVGAVRGALLHTREEWVEKESLIDGLRVILATMLASWTGRP